MSVRFETPDHLPKYFREISKIATFMTKEAEQVLADRIQGGDASAIELLVKPNLKYVVTVANKFVGLGLTIDDLIQEGNLGLLEAAMRFTSDKDTKFLTYAKFWIRKKINTAICENGRTVRLPVNQEYQIYKDKIKGTTENRTNVRLSMQVNENGNMTLGDLLLRQEFNDPFEDDDNKLLLINLLNSLSTSEKTIIELFYGLTGNGRSTKDVAEIVGKTPADVNRILKSARIKMRKKARLCTL